MRAQFLIGLIIALFLFSGGPSFGQDIDLKSLSDTSLSRQSLQIISLVTVLSLAPGIAIMVTCFPFIVTVLSILRQALGLQQAPPNMLLVSLSLFLTYYIMEPTFREAWSSGIDPYFKSKIEFEVAFQKTLLPFQDFMSSRVDPKTLSSFMELRNISIEENVLPPISVLIPSFMLSEIARAFQIGFLIFLPFLVIDLVVAAVLMSMGMMMVPPVVVSLPFKLAFFVVADGWRLLSDALVRGYFPT